MILAYAGATFIVIGFAMIINVLGLVEKSMKVIATCRDSVRVLSDRSLDDDHKEAAMQANAKILGWFFLVFLVGGAVALVAPTAVIWLLDFFGLISFDAVMEAILSIEFIVVGSLLAVAILWIGNRRRHGS